MHNIQPSIDYSGNKRWFMNGKLHREDGPAIEWANGNKSWWVNGILHRTDGPAIEWASCSIEWYLDGRYLTFDEWLDQTPGLTNKQKTFYRLQYS
jgi:hypothetical protein|tara:strand:- start:310 stop:594 length:285 start_codon:yes stop_codon:yes gene_type:complete